MGTKLSTESLSISSEISSETEEKGPPVGFGKSVNDYYNHYVTVADAKAGALLAADLVFIGLIVDQNYVTHIALLVHFVSVGILTISCLLSAWVLFPQLPRGKRGVIFWEDVRAYPNLTEYQTKLKGMSSVDIEMEYAHQNYLVSRVLHRKHRLLQWTIAVSLQGVIFSFLAYWLGV